MENKKFDLGHFSEFCNLRGDFEDFKPRVEELRKRDYMTFKTKSVLKKDPQFQKLMHSFKQASVNLNDNNFALSDRDQLSRFFQKVFEEMTSPHHLNIRFETAETVCDFLAQHLTAQDIPEKKKINTANLHPFPKIFVVTCRLDRNYDKGELVEQDEEPTILLDHLWLCMIPYLFSKPKEKIPQGEKPFHFLGVILTLEDAEIIWVKDFVPGLDLKKDQVSAYTVRWGTFCLDYFLNDSLNDVDVDDMNHYWFDGLAKFYMVLDFLCFVNCK